jgi:hypothetical protein
VIALVLAASALAFVPASPAAAVGEAPGAPVVLRTYRLALLSDPAYAAAVAAGAANEAESDAQVLAAKSALVDRLNQVFGEELAIRFELAPGSTNLNLRDAAEATGANGPCGTQPCFTPEQLTACTDDTMRRTRNVVGQLLGARNYEIGHLVLGSAAGGSSYPSTAGTEYRAFGCSGSSTPTGDGYVLDRLAHDLGHQLGANATFDSASCEEDRNGETAVEPGSGTSVMAGAGTCGADDLQADADPWFSTVSQDEIGLYVRGEGAVPEDAVAAEVQSVALTGFDGSDSFKLSFGGVETATITRGVNYSEAGIKAAVLAAVPSAVISKVRPFWQTGSFDDRGFELTFASFADVVEPVVVTVSGSFTAAVNDIDAGGLQLPGGLTSTPGNHTPVVTAPPGRTIPLRTPFALSGSATDADGDPLVYQWQQTDAGGAEGVALADPAKTDGPLFRTPAPTSSATRVFPDLAQVVAGHTNAETGSCVTGGVECWAEWLPTAAYTPSQLHFRLVSRDRDAAGGGVASGDVVLTVDKTTGPFRVTSHATPAELTGGTAQTVTWTANTAALAANVTISLSTDGGLTFGTVLAASTPNDGSHVVALPEIDASAVRLKVEAVGNYFFDVSDTDVSITPPPSGLTVTGVPASPATQHSDPLTFAFTAESTNAPAESLVATLTGLPDGLSLTEVGPASWAVTGTALSPPGTYPLHLEVTDGVATRAFSRTLVVAGESATATYDGPTGVAATQGGPDAVDLPLSATVAEVPDGTPAALSSATLTFTDASTGEVLCADVAVTDAGAATCTHSADLPESGSRTYQVALSLGGSWAGGSAAPVAVVVTAPGPVPDPTPNPPETSLTSVPPAWLLSSSTSVAYAASEAGSTFVCRLDGSRVPCGSSSLALSGLSEGTHRFTVAARGPDGALDPTPAAAVFTVPVDDRRLAVARGRWKRKAAPAAYRGTYTATVAKRATLTYQVSGVRALALVVGTGSRQGRVRIYVGAELVGRVRLSGAPGWARVVPVATFAVPRSGVVRIVTRNRKPVRIDGLGVLTS